MRINCLLEENEYVTIEKHSNGIIITNHSPTMCEIGEDASTVISTDDAKELIETLEDIIYRDGDGN
ncbi:hypothetical protein PSYJYH_000009 [Bacillus phage PSYJ-YH]|nr:hypothetical protein PSYJYH_000009 [Bacillus phage PSYJ-YH]